MLYNEYVAIGGSAESEHGKIIGKIVAGHGAPLPHPPHEAKNEPRFRREGHVSDGEGGAEANGPRIGTADGNIVIQTGGQHVSVKIGAADPVIIDELPVVVHSYTDQALRQFVRKTVTCCFRKLFFGHPGARALPPSAPAAFFLLLKR